MNPLVIALAAIAALAQNTPSSTHAPAQISNPNDPSTWTTSVDLATYLPCSRWRRNPDGSWTLTGTANLGGAMLTDVSFGPGHETEILESRCGPKK